jgi:predicted nucleic acid-binding protein
MTLTDTGPLVALLDKSQGTQHLRCQNVLPSLSSPLVTTREVWTETIYLLGRELGYPGQKALWRLRSSGQLMLHESSSAEVDRMEVLMEQYRDTPMDLADASLVVAAETLGLRRVFTLDRHFYAYRLSDGSALEVVP